MNIYITLLRLPRIEHGLSSREGLRYNNHERLLRVQVVQGPTDINGVDIREEPQPVQLGLLPPRILLSLESLPNKKRKKKPQQKQTGMTTKHTQIHNGRVSE